MRVLTIVPSRGRPILLMDMMESWARTRECDGKLVAYISSDDPMGVEYHDLVARLPKDCYILTGPRRYITATYNAIVAENPGYDYYCPLNDDHYCITPGWDQKLIELMERETNGWGCGMADDHLTDWAQHPHPSGCLISKKTIDVLGCMFYPKLRHIGNDVIMGKLFGALGILSGTKDVVIEHRHWVNSMRPMDDNYKWVYGKEEQDYGDNMVREYFAEQYHEDYKKLQEAMARK